MRRKRPRTFHERAFPPSEEAEKARGKAHITLIAAMRRACSAKPPPAAMEKERREGKN